MRGRTEQLTRRKGRDVRLLALLLLPAVVGCGERGFPLGPPDMATSADIGSGDSSQPLVDQGQPDVGRFDMGEQDQGGVDQGGADDLGAPLDLGGGGCAVVAGTYSVGATGIGCGALGTSQVLQQATAGSCMVQFATPATLSGAVTVASDGSFVGQTLLLNGTSRTCRGTWTPALARYSVVCGSGPTICNITLE